MLIRSNKYNPIESLLEWVSSLICLIVTGLMLFIILSRYVFHWSIGGASEITLVFAMWLYMLGAVLASHRKQQIVVDLLPTSIKNPKFKLYHELLVSIITLCITIFFARWTYEMFIWGLKRPQTIPTLDISLFWSQAAVGVAAVGCVVQSLADTLRALIGVLKINKKTTG